jgi:lipoprotein-anchoring transpeptidase ErfK/SrfK
MTAYRKFVWTAMTLATVGAMGGFTTAPAAPNAVAEGAETSNLRLEVSLSERKLRAKVGDKVVGTYPVAIGKEGHATPKGSFTIRRVIWNPPWVPPNAPWAKGKKATPAGDPNNPMGRVKIFFHEPDYYIHGTNDPKSVGKAVSHGCLRMKNDDAMELARIVMEHGGRSKPDSWFRNVRNRVTNTQEVRLQTGVSIRIRS